MKPHLLTSLSFVAAAGCFSGGSAIESAPDAVAVLVAPQGDPCASVRPTYWPYIGAVAIAPGSGGYALELPWSGPECESNNGGDGNQTPTAAVSVAQFGAAGAPIAGSAIGSAGTTNGTPLPHLAVDPADGSLAWAYGIGGGGGGSSPDIAAVFGAAPTTPIALNISFPGGPAPSALGMVLSAGEAYVAVSQAMSTTDPDSPQFPSCCDNSNGGSATGNIYRVDAASSTVTLLTSADVPVTAAEPLVANSADLFYLVTASEPGSVVEAFPLSGSAAAVMVGALDAVDIANETPVGIAATDHYVAWSGSVDVRLNVGAAGCEVDAVDLTSAPLGQGSAQVIFQTSSFNCTGLAIDDTSAYFTIVHVENNQNALHGDGIGRVSLDGSTFESIAVGMTGEASGPRRIYLDSDSLYAVDPIVIGKLAKSALDGKHDFTP